MGFEVHSSKELNANRVMVHQRCMEVKSLAAENKVGWFQDVLEILHSNREIFLRFPQQLNSLCSSHLCDVQSVPSSSVKTHITLLRPSKFVNGAFEGTKRKGHKHAEKFVQMDEAIECIRKDAKLAHLKHNESPAQPTRIVVLKPGYSGRSFAQPQRNGREVDKEIPSLKSETHRRDESLISSIFSNGYIGDESASDMSENDTEMANLSGSEIMSPPSSHSSVDVKRSFHCSRSSSSFCRSPESSVYREAKKRLSRRWARIASNVRSEEQKHLTTSSCTLGDMLALNDMKIMTSEQELAHLTSCSSETTKAKGTGSSFKGRVSGLFFSKNKKQNAHKFSSAARGTSSFPGQFTSEKPLVRPTESHDEPSPTSVFEPSFEEDKDVILDLSVNHKPQHPANVGRQVFPSASLIDKSPPIGSIARSLSWNDSDADAATTLPLNPSCISLRNKNEEQNWINAVKLLLSMAGLNYEVPFDSFSARWHSPDIPLDPSLRNQYANMHEEQPQGGESKRRQCRSSRKLIFDSVNAAIVEIARSLSGANSIISGAFPLLVVDHLRMQMRDCFCGGGWSTSDERHRFSQVVWRIVKKEVVGREWFDQIKMPHEDIGMEVQCQLLDDLLEEAVADLMVWRHF